MARRAKEGTCLATLVKMAIPFFQKAERPCPRTGPGRKPEIPDWVIALLITTFGEKIDHLSSQTLYVLADSGYDNNTYADRIEREEKGRRTGKRFLCPENPRNSKQSTKKEKGTTKQSESGEEKERRKQRRRFLESRRGQKLYARRGATVEPFNEWFKSLFEPSDRVWHRGLDNNRT